jgi:TM2 domain
MKKIISVAFYLCILMALVPSVKAAFPVKHISEQVVNQQSSSMQEELNVKEQVQLKSMPSKQVKKPGYGGSKSQIVALILCVLVGGIGIHRFYLGYTWQGVVQLLTAGGCGIWALIDFIRILTGSLQPKDGYYDQSF